MTLGHHGAVMIHVPIVVLVLLNNNVRDGNSFKYPRVHKRVNRYNTNINYRIAIIEVIGVQVSSNSNMIY